MLAYVPGVAHTYLVRVKKKHTSENQNENFGARYHTVVCRLTPCEHTYANTYPTLKPRLVEHTRIHTKTNIIIRADVFSRADVQIFFLGCMN